MEQKKDELIFARHVIRKEVKGDKESITMFFGGEEGERLLNMINEAKAAGEDGFVVSILLGQHAKGTFAGVSSRGLENRNPREKPYNSQQNQSANNATTSAPAKSGGYTPNKRPGYSNSRWSK